MVLKAAQDHLDRTCGGPGSTENVLNSKGRAIPLVTLTLPPGGGLWSEEAPGRVLYSTGFRAGRLLV